MKNAITILALLLLTSFYSQITAQNQTKIDSLLKVLETMPEDTNKVITLNKLIYKFYNSDPKRFKEYTEEQLKLSKKIDFKKGIMKSFYFFGVYYRMIGDYDTAIKKIEDGLEFKKSHFKDAKITYFYELLGDVYDSQGDFPLAIKNYIRVLKVAEQNSNNEEIASLKLRIGSVFMKNNKADQAILYFNEAYNIFKQLNNKRGMGISLTYIARFNQDKKKYEKAITFYNKVVELYKESNSDLLLLADINAHIASVYTDMNKFEQAINYYEKSLSISNKINHKFYQTITMAEIAYVYTLKKEYKKSVEISHKCINISNQIKAPQTLLNPYQNLSLAYIGLLNKDSAEFYFNAWQNISDSINSIENRKMVTELQTIYETEKKEQEIITLKKEKELQKAESQNKTYLLIMSALLMFIAGIVIFFYVRNQKNKHRQKIIEERAKEAENQKKRFAKELHDGTGSNLTGIRLQLLALKDKIQGNGEFSEIIKEVDRTHQSIRLLSYQVVPPEFDNYTLDQATHDLVRRLSKTGSININYSSTVNIDWSHTDKEYQLEIYRIIQEALSNVIKHSEAKNVDIQLIQHETSFNLMIEDDGKGFILDKVKKGLGLNSIKQRTNKINGTLNIDSTPEKGTSLIIDFPIPKIMKHAV